MSTERDRFENDEEVTVTLTLEDDSEIECSVVTIFDAGEHSYIALLPTTGEDAESGTVYLYRYVETEDGEPELENIADDDEYELASEAFDEFLDSSEFDELITEDET